jgi:hypothetical protein
MSGLLLAASLVFLTPIGLGPAGVTVWFVVLLGFLGTLLALIFYTAKTFLHSHTTGVARLRYSLRQGFLIGGWGTAMLALRSVRQLSLLDAILLALLLLIVEVYVRLRWP